MTGRGVIIGSDVTGFQGIEVKVIGNEQNRRTNLTVGCDPLILEEINLLEKEIEILDKKMKEEDLNISFIEQIGDLSPKYKQVYDQLKFANTVTKMALAKKEKRMQKLRDDQNDVSCQITASTIYPPLYVSVCSAKTLINTTERMRRIYKDDGEVKMAAR